MSPTRHRTAVLTIILLSYLMIVVDISIVITGLPRIRTALDLSATGLSWVQNAYTLAFGGLLLLGARAGDILGRRRMFVTGLGVLTVASLAVGLAQGAAWLVTARAVQGSVPRSSLRRRSPPDHELPRGSRAHPCRRLLRSGRGRRRQHRPGPRRGPHRPDLLERRLLRQRPGRIAMMLAARRYLAETEPRPGRFDLMGTLSSTLGMTALVYGIVRSAEAGWRDDLTVATIAAGALLLALFAINERYAAQPIMPLRLFSDRERVGASVGRLLFLGAMVGFWYFSTKYLQGVLGFSPLVTGIAYLPVTVPNLVAALAVPRLTRRVGNGRLLAFGAAVSLVGMAWLSRAAPASSYLTAVALPMVLIGTGQGATLGPLTAAGIARVASEDAGAASGLVNVTHQLGGSIGLGILVTVFASAGSGALAGDALLAQRIGTTLGVGSVMLALMLIVVPALVVAPGRRKAAPART